MKEKKKIYLILTLLILFIMLARSPIIVRLPSDDSGVFLYNAWRIQNGDILYKNLWDHKPPLIHFINALALSINQNSIWGVWLIQSFYLIAAVLIGFEVLQMILGVLPAALAAFILIMSLNLTMAEGNYTQDYAIFFQFSLLYLFIRKELNPKKLYYFLIGLCGGILFFLQSNLIGIYIAIFIYELFRFSLLKKKISTILINLAGFLIITTIILFYFYTTNSLRDYYEAVWIYNRSYITKSVADIFLTVYVGLTIYMISGLTILAFIGIFLFLKNSYKAKSEKFSPIFKLVLIALPIDLFLASVSGRPSMHYYVTFLPTLTFFAAYVIYQMTTHRIILHKIEFIILFTALVSIPSIYTLSQQTLSQLKISKKYYPKYQQIKRIIQQNTTSNDYVLVWGIESRTNFIIKRRSPTKFSYQFALFTTNFDNRTSINEIIFDLKKNKPKYIIDIPKTNSFMPPLDKKLRLSWKPSVQGYSDNENAKVIYRYIDKNYSLKERIEMWSIYKRID